MEHSNTSIETIAMGTTEKYRKYQNKNIKTKSVAFACLPRLRYRPERSQPTAQTQYLNRASINRMREARRATQRGTRAAERHRKQNNRKAERANAHKTQNQIGNDNSRLKERARGSHSPSSPPRGSMFLATPWATVARNAKLP